MSLLHLTLNFRLGILPTHKKVLFGALYLPNLLR